MYAYLAFRTLTTLAAIAGVVWLAMNDKAGWGWLIVLAIVINCG